MISDIFDGIDESFNICDILKTINGLSSIFDDFTYPETIEESSIVDTFVSLSKYIKEVEESEDK